MDRAAISWPLQISEKSRFASGSKTTIIISKCSSSEPPNFAIRRLCERLADR